MLESIGSMWQRQQFHPSGTEQQRAWSAGVLPLILDLQASPGQQLMQELDE